MDDVKFQDVVKNDSTGPDIMVVKFADSAVPVFKEKRNKDYIEYGSDNLYPEYLTYLFNKSSKHNAIIGGKAKYIFGNGYENGDIAINRYGETLNDITKRALLDIEIYGGCRLEIIWGINKKIVEVFHCDYSSLRKGKEGGFYFKESWLVSNRDEAKFIPSFDQNNPVGSQIYEYNEYRPGVRYYPLPGYIGSNNYIETDIEISKYYLSSIRNGMMPSKAIEFFIGDPTDDKKREIEGRFQKKFTGAENAGKFVMIFNTSKDKSVNITDLSASELDKHFVELNKTTQQEIYAGHGITSPMLFGIKTEGQLGGSTELATAYSIFQNTYSKPKAISFDKELNFLLKYSMFAGLYELKPSDPIGIQFDVKDVVNSLPKQFVFESLGIPKEMWGLENIGADNRPSATTPIPPSGQVSLPGQQAAVNDTIKNLSGRQHQGIMRIVRQYNDGQGKLTRTAATAMLKKGFGLDDEDVIAFLGPDVMPVQMSFSAEDIIAVFDEYGDSRNDYEILKSKRVCFSGVEDIESDETIWQQEAFKTYDVTLTENKILELIKKDDKITSEVIADVIGETKAYVDSRLKSLTARGFLEVGEQVIGSDTIISRVIPARIDIVPPVLKSKPPQVYIKYSYEWNKQVPVSERNSAKHPSRPFCVKMMQLNRLYSRQDIEQITQRLGYSVFDRNGGFWNKGNGVISDQCRHLWKSNIIVKKGGSNVA